LISIGYKITVKGCPQQITKGQNMLQNRRVLLFLQGLLLLVGCSCTQACVSNPTSTSDSHSMSEQAVSEKVKIEDLHVGTGEAVHAGQKVTINYTGRFQNGTIFDSSDSHGGPADFQLDADHIIRGYIDGMEGMKVGGKRRLVIPPSLAYGERGIPPTIPPHSTLTFEIELVAIKH
jgi:FKBP-type peptidyl-prolyl cis-trans isomerase